MNGQTKAIFPGSIFTQDLDKLKLFQLLVKLCNLNGQVEIEQRTRPCYGRIDDPINETGYKSVQNEVFWGENAIYHLLAQQSKDPTLMGTNLSQKIQVQALLQKVSSKYAVITEAVLEEVNQSLEKQAFLVGSSPSMADFVMYGHLHKYLTGIPIAQTNVYCNLLRWFDFCQNVYNLENIYQKVQIQKPNFERPKLSEQVIQRELKKPIQATPQIQPNQAQQQSDIANKSSTVGQEEQVGSIDKGNSKGSDKKDAKGTKDKKEKKQQQSKEDQNQEPRVDMLDIRVGKIVDVKKHPNADALYLESIDVGESEPRQIISGLVKYVPVEDMMNRYVVVICNLKPQKLKDIVSFGMVLCAADTDKKEKQPTVLEPIKPPQGVQVGESIFFDQYQNKAEEQINPKKKILESLYPDLKVIDGVCVYKQSPLKTKLGVVTASVSSGFVS